MPAVATKIPRAYGALLGGHRVVAEAVDEVDLARRLCALLVDELGYSMAWVGAIRDDHVVRPLAHAGFDSGYLEAVTITWSEDEATSQGPTGRAVRSRQPQVCLDIATDPHFLPWRTEASARGYACSAALPMCHGARCLAVVNVYAFEPRAFDDDELALLEEMIADLTLALVVFRTQGELGALSSRVAQLGRAEAAVAALATVIHDASSLLQSATLTLEIGRDDQAMSVQDIDDALRAVVDASELMHRLATWARRVQSEGHVQVDAVIRTVSRLLSRLAIGPEVTFRLEASGASVALTAVDLERILINLVVNARDALHGAGTIRVETEVRACATPTARRDAPPLPVGAYVALSVIDDGPGIEPAALERVFEPFFTTKGAEGSGLGLASVREIARSVGGDVSVRSEVGRGAAFTVLLPVRVEAESAL